MMPPSLKYWTTGFNIGWSCGLTEDFVFLLLFNKTYIYTFLKKQLTKKHPFMSI